VINLYDSTNLDFSHNGLVVLSDCKTAFIEEELNGKYELVLEYPIDARGKWRYIVEEKIIKVAGQLFRIYHKEKTIAGIKVSARHIFYDLLDNFVESCSIGNLNAAGALNSILSSTQYSHGYTSMSDIDASNTYTIDKQNPVEAIMGDGGVISRYGGELLRDNFSVRLNQARGMDRGVLISYGKNVIGIDETLDIGSVVTRILPIGKNGLLLPEKYLDSPFIGNFPHPIVKFIEFKDIETEDALRSSGQTYLSQNDKPLVNYKVDFIELTKTIEYKNYSILETVYMGDTVTVRHSKLGIDIECKVIRIKNNELTNRIEEVELGSFKPNLATSINTAITTINNQLAQDKSDLQIAIDNATTQINSALGGYVVKRNGELLIMDTEDIFTATKVWRWNEGGLGYSGTGYNGPFETAITADGHIVADFIDTGTLTASLIKTGTLTSKTGKLSIGIDDEVLNIGGKIVYDGATGHVTFAPDVVLSWENIDPTTIPPLSPDFGSNFTAIGNTWIYTGTLGAQQVKGLLLEGVTILAGKISGLDNAAILHIGESGGNINTAYDLTAGVGYRASIRLIPGTMDNAHCGYLQVLENGEVYFYDNVDANQGTPYASIRHDGFYLGAGLAYAPVGTTTIVYKSDGTGFDTDLDGSQDSWTWTKDGNGRITKLVSSGSRVVNVTY